MVWAPMLQLSCPSLSISAYSVEAIFEHSLNPILLVQVTISSSLDNCNHFLFDFFAFDLKSLHSTLYTAAKMIFWKHKPEKLFCDLKPPMACSRLRERPQLPTRFLSLTLTPYIALYNTTRTTSLIWFIPLGPSLSKFQEQIPQTS